MESQLTRTLKSLVLGMPALITGGEPRFRAGDALLAINQLGWPAWITLWSDAFEHEAALPEYVAGEKGQPPPLRWTGVPAGSRSLVLLIEDPDAPTARPFLHWAVYNIDPSLPELEKGARFAVEGKNSMLKKGFAGAAPPKGDRPHRYHFQLFALDRLLELPDSAGRSALLEAMKGHVLAAGEVIGTYAR